MKKHIIGNHPEIELDFNRGSKFFNKGNSGFEQPDFGEKLGEIKQEGNKIILKGESDTIGVLRAPEYLLEEMEIQLKNRIGIPLGEIERIELE